MHNAGLTISLCKVMGYGQEGHFISPVDYNGSLLMLTRPTVWRSHYHNKQDDSLGVRQVEEGYNSLQNEHEPYTRLSVKTFDKEGYLIKEINYASTFLYETFLGNMEKPEQIRYEYNDTRDQTLSTSDNYQKTG